MKKIRVLVVDDSAAVRMTLSKMLNKYSDIEVIGVANDPYIARDKIVALKPDVLTLDVEMPRMDGLTFLRKLMKHYPLPVVMVSALTQKGCATTLSCLAAGAIDFVTKEASFDVTSKKEGLISEIAEKVRIAASAKVKKPLPILNQSSAATRPAVKSGSHAMIKSTNKIVAIGASTGGTEAITSVLTRLPSDSPGIVIVQHMPEKFTRSFAERLNSLCSIEVREAQGGESVIPGVALIAPGNYHMMLRRDGARYYVQLGDDEPVCRHRPSVEVLFNSVAKYAGANAVGVMLTGMGGDGSDGMLKMKNEGGKTLAQDEDSCVVFGMPKEAIRKGGVDRVVNLEQMPKEIINMIVKL